MPPDDATSVALVVAEGLAAGGAEAVVLVGSHARGDAGPEWDVDVSAVGTRTFSFRLERRGCLLVSVTSRPAEAYRRELVDPGSVCAAVPDWREAVMLHDPAGTRPPRWSKRPRPGPGGRWRGAATRGWPRRSSALAEEEVHRLVSSLRAGRCATAAQRSVLAVRLAGVRAVHQRILYGSENRLWDLVAEATGEGWRRTQSAALGLGDEWFEETCRAALKLYGLAIDNVNDTSDERQQRVARQARDLAVFSRRLTAEG